MIQGCIYIGLNVSKHNLFKIGDIVQYRRKHARINKLNKHTSYIVSEVTTKYIAIMSLLLQGPTIVKAKHIKPWRPV